MLRSFATIIVAAVMVAAGSAAQAVTFTFVNADAPLPAVPGNGLNGEVWTGVDVNDLGAARAYIASNAPDATFLSTTVDYPNGTAGSLSTSSTFATALGTDAATLSDPTVASLQVLNSILKFSGFLRIDAPTTILALGVGSDDGSDLVIQGTQVIANDGIHPFPGGNAGPTDVTFLEAGLYQLEVLFFESQPVQWGLEFFVGAPGAGTPVPTTHLYTSLGPPIIPVPAGLPLLFTGLVGLAVVRRKRRSLVA